MNKELSKYVESNYKDGKADLFSVFMLLSERLLAEKGKYGMINMQSWMFLSSFKELRRHVIKSLHIDNMLHLGPRTFDELSGEVVQNTTFVISKYSPIINDKGTYYRLVRGKNCDEKNQLFISHINSNDDDSRIYYPNVEQKNFEKIPGSPIGYWVSNHIFNIFENSTPISNYSTARSGFSTGNNDLFIRTWNEVSFKSIGLGLHNNEEFITSGLKYVPFTSGGSYRKWYGNQNNVVNWTRPESMHRPRTTYMYLYYKPAITWNAITSGLLSCRAYNNGFLFEHAAASLFVADSYDSHYFLAYINTTVFRYLLGVLNPTLNNGAEVVSSVPIVFSKANISSYVEDNILISKQDWDAHETSWDFQRNELLSIDSDTYIDNINYKIEKHFEETGEHICIDPATPQLDSLEWRMEQYKTKWERNFMQLHKNEEELNRQFIDIYGLQDELTPDVPFNEITILQQGEISIKNNAIVWNDDVIIKQLISYAVGCWMGRYRLDKPGLNIAYYPDDKEICSYKYNGKSFTIDDDGIIPLMGGQNPFEDDNAIQKMVNFVHIVFGDEHLTENLNFIEHSLGKSIEDYLIKDFWKDHKKMYQNRPIYWLFSSKKGAFQVLVYMHRMNPYTAEKVRTKYLLPYIEYLQTRIQQDNERGADLTTIERKNLTKMEAALVECQEYHDRLHSIADKQINFDLDDGVVVNYAKFGDVLAKIK